MPLTKSFAGMLDTLTGQDNRGERRSLAYLFEQTAQAFADDLQVNCRIVGELREQAEGHLSLVVAVRALWTLTPERLFTAADPDFERLATAALRGQHGSEEPSAINVRRLSIVFRRLRQSQSAGVRYTGLDLGRADHAGLLVDQGGRCAVCRYRFTESDLDYSNVGLDSEPGTEREPGEERLDQYRRSPELDHIIPKFLGGDDRSNWQILCGTCNSGKGEGLAWILRRGLLPASRPSEAMRITPSLRYAVLCGFHSAATGVSMDTPDRELLLFRKERSLLPVFDNLTARPRMVA